MDSETNKGSLMRKTNCWKMGMEFIIYNNTSVVYDGNSKAVLNAVNILERDIKKTVISKTGDSHNEIVLETCEGFGGEEFTVIVGEHITVQAGSELGFVYGLLYISEKFLEIKPFWFWMDQKIEKAESIPVKYGEYRGSEPIIKYRGWFVNDEVLIMKWKINGDEDEPWRMVFEALLRCGGNMVIPGTDKDSRKYRDLASEMGLWITHHHAEPLGAEMFVRAYPHMTPDYSRTPELFHKLWEDSVIAQKDYKTVWTLGFRGQGDCPFWSNDTSGMYDTPQKRGALISEIIELQRQIVEKYVEHPVFCTNLYGEVMELYDQGHIKIADDIIKISADNGYGKMVTRRRDNHTVRISSIPATKEKHAGIYYHVSFYDLQAANHITMLPNSVDFVNRELNEVLSKNMTDYWIINCSNVRPHVYFLDALRKKWFGQDLSDETHSREFAETYFGGNEKIAEAYRDYHKAMAEYGFEEDEHAGEQFFTENLRLLIHAFFNGKTEGTSGLKWLMGDQTLDDQIETFAGYCRRNLENISAFHKRCLEIADSLEGETAELFRNTLALHAGIYYYCTIGVIGFADGYKSYTQGDFLKAFIHFGDSAEAFDRADFLMQNSESGVWKGFYYNECFADVKHTAYMVKKIMGYVREKGDNARHDKWYREAVYSAEDRKVFTLLVTDNHMTDWELYSAFKKNKNLDS